MYLIIFLSNTLKVILFVKQGIFPPLHTIFCAKSPNHTYWEQAEKAEEKRDKKKVWNGSYLVRHSWESAWFFKWWWTTAPTARGPASPHKKVTRRPFRFLSVRLT